jgi:hypothetical protein
MREYQEDNFDWASKNMKEIEVLIHASCQWLQEKGYNGKALKAKANVQPNSMHNAQIRHASTAEECDFLVIPFSYYRAKLLECG